MYVCYVYRLKSKSKQNLRLMKNHDVLDFSTLYKEHWERLFKQIIRILPDEEDACDVVQQTFVDLWEIRDKIHEIKSVQSFLFIMARNIAFKRLKRSLRDEAYFDHYLNRKSELTEVVDEWLFYKEMNSMLNHEIEQLPSKMKEMFVLSRLEGLSYVEIAERLGKSDKTVKKQISNAIKILKLKLGLKYSLPFLAILLF